MKAKVIRLIPFLLVFSLFLSGLSGCSSDTKNSVQAETMTNIQSDSNSHAGQMTGDKGHTDSAGGPLTENSGQALAEGTVQQDEIIDSYSELLYRLSINDEKSIQKALDEYKCCSKATNGTPVNDRLFRLFKTFFTLAQASIKDGLLKPEEKPDDLLIAQNGFVKSFSEEGEILIEDPVFLLDNFSGTVTEGVRSYLKIRSRELKDYPFIDDAGYSIGWNEMSDRIVEWEGYAGKYPDYPEAVEANESAEGYLKMYLVDFGLDNTPMFRNSKLTAGLKASYERFIGKYAGSGYHPVINEYYNILRKNNFILTDEARKFLSQKGLSGEKASGDDNVISMNKYYSIRNPGVDKIRVRMTEGRHYEDKEPGPFQGWNYEGRFALEALDKGGRMLSSLDLNSAFGEEVLMFGKVFRLKFEDYNSDGYTDFAIGQHSGSNGFSYRIFSIRDNADIICLPFKGNGAVFSSQKEYSAVFQKVDPLTFKAPYYDNTRGKYLNTFFKWAGSEFYFDREEEKYDILNSEIFCEAIL